MTSVAITSAITLIGLYVAHGLRRQQRLRIADRRISSYCELWNCMEVVRPSRLEDGKGYLTSEEMQTLYDSMTAWYFDSGNGLMLTESTLTVYLVAKRRVGASISAIATADDRQRQEISERRIRELSLLRTQMKSDVAIYGNFYSDSLDLADEEFLRACGHDPSRWATPRWRKCFPRRLTRRRARPGPRFPAPPGTNAPRARD